jgi:hypothetical protein
MARTNQAGAGARRGPILVPVAFGSVSAILLIVFTSTTFAGRARLAARPQTPGASVHTPPHLAPRPQRTQKRGAQKSARASTLLAYTKLSHTVVRHIRPTTSAGMLKAGYRVGRRLSRAECPEESRVIGGEAYLCNVGESGGGDPCWPDGPRMSADAVYCLHFPWSREVTELALAHTLPRPLSTTPFSSAWGLELTNGFRCNALISGTEAFDGSVVRFGCSPGARFPYTLHLLGQPTKNNGLWVIRSVSTHEQGGQDGKHHDTLGPVERVAVAWYGE